MPQGVTWAGLLVVAANAALASLAPHWSASTVQTVNVIGTILASLGSSIVKTSSISTVSVAKESTPTAK